MEDNFAPAAVAISMPQRTPISTGFSRLAACFSPEESALSKRRLLAPLAEALRDHFFGPQNLIPPEESAFYAHDNPPLVFRKLRGLVADHPVKRAVHRVLLLDFGNLHPVQDLSERMDGVLEVILPMPQLAANTLSAISCCLEL